MREKDSFDMGYEGEVASGIPIKDARRGKKVAQRLGLKNDHVFDYKDPGALRYFITDRGKIVPRRISGLSARQQRALTVAIKRARQIALLPFTRPNL